MISRVFLMKHRIISKRSIAILFFSFAFVVFGETSLGKARSRKPKAGNPARHSFPALGISAECKVQVMWNRFYDHAGLSAILSRLHKAFPELTKLYSIGKSTQGRDIWCLEVTARDVGDPDRKPGMYIDGNIHGNEVQTSETVAYTAWYLCHQYGRLDKVTSLLDERVFYLLATINPDGRDLWLHSICWRQSIPTAAICGFIAEVRPDRAPNRRTTTVTVLPTKTTARTSTVTVLSR